ncbi:hypothetical protein [Pseudomonas cavernicola]|uniref:hypothetical protein n=1 Tax=Pseudomonas cavernicola TaxID=2320866 RepID=UPI0011C4A57A|nr:hypothetical protein [Pseudomonas cavernicola]
MRTQILAALTLAALCSAGAYAQEYLLRPPGTPPPGSPGTATPTPYQQVTPHSAPEVAPNLPRLLNNNTSRLPRADSVNPRGQAIPLLEQQLQRNSKSLPPERTPQRD